MIIKRITTGILAGLWALGLLGCSSQRDRTPAQASPSCSQASRAFLTAPSLTPLLLGGELSPAAAKVLVEAMSLPPPKRLRKLTLLVRTPEDFDALLVFCTRYRAPWCLDNDIVNSLRRTHPIAQDLDWVEGEPLAYALEKETTSTQLGKLFRPQHITPLDWERIPLERQYQILISSRSSDLLRTNKGYGFLGDLKKEGDDVAELAHARFTLSRKQLKTQIQAIEALFKERRGFHIHVSFPESYIEESSPFFVWHQMANLWIYLKQAKVGAVGDARTGLPFRHLLPDAVKNPALKSLPMAKMGGLGFRHSFLSGGGRYQVYKLPRVGLELRDGASGAEEISQKVNWIRDSIVKKSWEKWKLGPDEIRQVLAHHHPQNEDSLVLASGTQTEALFLREFSVDSVFLWPLAPLEDWSFPVLENSQIRWHKLQPTERQKLVRARELYKNELQKTRDSLADFLSRNPETPEYEQLSLVRLAIMGDFALWAKHADLDQIYGAALRPE